MNPVPLSSPSTTLDPYDQAWQRLISGVVPQDELASLIDTIFSNEKVANMVDLLQGIDAQTFIDVIDTALDNPNLIPHIRRRSMKLLRAMCARHTLVTSSLKIELYDDPPGPPVCRGGFGDVWEREYRGRRVAVKVLRTYASSDLQNTIRKFCKEFVPWKALRHPNVLPLLGVIMTETKFAMVSEWMSNGNINEFVTAHQDANRFELLADVSKGLIYMHGQRMVHGDLKGANILVDQTCHARLADFGLLTFVSDSTTSSSFTEGGTVRWMSPELFDSDAQANRRTKYSDCYALGMVVYEVLSLRKPFYKYTDFAVVGKVVKGERPEIPQGLKGIVGFTDDVWEVLGHCWTPLPRDRPSIKGVLNYLEKAASSWTPPPLPMAIPSPVNSPTSSTSDIVSEESMDVDAVVMDLAVMDVSAVTDEPAHGFSLLKAVLGAISAVYSHFKETITVRNEIEDLLARIAALEVHFATPPGDMAESNRRSDLISKFSGIEGQLQYLYKKPGLQRLTDHVQDDKEVSGLLEDLRVTIFDYQMVQQMYEQESKLVAARNARRIEYVLSVHVQCDTGMFAGRTIRAEVNEVQKANVGRKYAASKEQRALDPPPVIELRVFNVRDTGNGTTQETEVDYNGLQLTGLVCYVEVFQVPMTTEEDPAQVTDLPTLPSTNPSYPRIAPNGQSVEVYWRNQPITTTANHTSSLVGGLFAQAMNLPIGPNGKFALAFVFADLSVPLEGWFLFKYRVFDLFFVTNRGTQPILAECWGRPFRVYATKQFPGLGPSTELTKLLHSHHVPVCVREVRRRCKKNVNDSGADSD